MSSFAYMLSWITYAIVMQQAMNSQVKITSINDTISFQSLDEFNFHSNIQIYASSDVAQNPDNPGWKLNPRSKSGWLLGLRMNETTFGFKQGIDSNLTITIEGNSSVNQDMIISLSMYDDFNAYWNNGEDGLYWSMALCPNCDWSGTYVYPDCGDAALRSNFATGNIYNAMQQQEILTNWQIAGGPGGWSKYGAWDRIYEENPAWNISISLEYELDGNLKITTWNTENIIDSKSSCYYQNITTDQHMDLYVAAGHFNYTNFEIYKFILATSELLGNPTNAASQTPNSTFDLITTEIPSQNATKSTSNASIPTSTTTISSAPTSNPTTQQPTPTILYPFNASDVNDSVDFRINVSSTAHPTKSTTNAPFTTPILTSNSTMHPVHQTQPPTASGTTNKAPTTSIITSYSHQNNTLTTFNMDIESGEVNGNTDPGVLMIPNVQQTKISTLYIIIIAAGGLFVVVCALVIFSIHRSYRSKKPSEDLYEMPAGNIELHKAVPSSSNVKNKDEDELDDGHISKNNKFDNARRINNANKEGDISDSDGEELFEKHDTIGSIEEHINGQLHFADSEKVQNGRLDDDCEDLYEHHQTNHERLALEGEELQNAFGNEESEMIDVRKETDYI